MKNFKQISVIGAGSWGTAVANLLADNGLKVLLWGRDYEQIVFMQKNRVNPRYLTDLKLHQNLAFSADLQEAVAFADLLVMAVPSMAMRTTMLKMKPFLKQESYFLSLTKGLEENSYLTMSEVIAEVAGPGSKVAALSGPNHAEEVSKKIPSATVIASLDEEYSRALQELFLTSYFRVYTNSDIKGVEIAGATKNVIAIAAGVSDGLGFGDNTKASLITRGVAEITRLGLALGAQPLTFAGLAGIGDLIVTCISRYSRNRAVGELLAKGYSLEEIKKQTTMVAEGIKTAPVVLKLATKNNIEVPICASVVALLNKEKKPQQIVTELLGRTPTAENY